MKKERNYNFFSLIKLYLSYVFTKGTIIIFIVSICLMVVSLILISNPWLDNNLYLENPKAVTSYFLNDSLLLIQIFNSILVITALLMLVNKSQSFDILFISYVKRKMLAVVKFISILIIEIILSIIEIIIIVSICKIRYSEYELTIDIFLSFLVLLLTIIFESSLGILISTLFRNIFAITGVLFIFITYRILINNFITHLNEYLKYIPVVIVNKDKLCYEMPSFIFVIAYSFLFVIIYISIYSLIDIKNKE